MLSLEEKLAHPRSKYAVPGLYLYDGKVVDIDKSIKHSEWRKLEIRR